MGVDCEKLQKLSNLGSALNVGAGQHSCWFTLWPNLTQGTIHFNFNWKSSIENHEFHSLDEAITKLVDMNKRVAE